MVKQNLIMEILILILFNLYKIQCFNSRHNPVSSIDLTLQNQSFEIIKNILFYPQTVDDNERFKILQLDENRNYLVLGARNRLLTVSSSEGQVKIYESYFPIKEKGFKDKNCSDRSCANYILQTLPIKSQNSNYNQLICGTYYGLFQCIQAEQNKENGMINLYDLNTLIKAPKSITQPINNQNAYYISSVNKSLVKSKNVSEYILYAASSWTDHSQYLAAHSSENNYQDDSLNKKIGVSKSFVKFVEENNKLFLFQNEFSFDIDDGERDRDILISTSLVTQMCKNNQEILNKDPSFYTELTAKIYCFNDAFKANSGNSRNFKFDSLEYVTDVFKLNDKSTNETRKLFYGVFNTPKNQITGTAICFFDINDLSNVFQKQNFKYSENTEEIAKNSQYNPQDCPNLTFLEKFKYRSFTSKLSYMTKAALPIKKRRASFINTNEYRITSLLVIDNQDASNQIYPSIKKLDNLNYFNIILAGTDNGKLMRIVHHFGYNYFKTEDLDQEKVEILEEIQLFDKNSAITEIQILNGGKDEKKIFAISNKQIKSISTDFCQLYSSSCENCLIQNKNTFHYSKCVWNENRCKTLKNFNKNIDNFFFSQIEQCDLLKQPTTVSTSKPTIKSAEETSSTFKQTFIDKYSNKNTQTLTIKHSNMNLFNNLVTHETLNISNLLMLNSLDYKQIQSNITNTSRRLKKREENLIFYTLISISVSAFALIIGIVIGYLIKSKYCTQILNKILRRNKNEFNDQNGLNKSIQNSKYQANLYSGLNDISKIRLAQKPFDENDQENSFNNSVDSSKSEHLSDSNSSNSSRNNSYNKNYFTVQTNYGLFPKKLSTSSESPPIHSAKRLSSLSSSGESTYGVFNLVNSQTCLLNNSKINGSKINAKDTFDARTTFGQSILLNANRPPLNQKNLNQSDIVVNDDDFKNDYQIKTQRYSYLSTSSFNPSFNRQLESASSSVSNSFNQSNSSNTTRSNKYYKHHHMRKNNSVSNVNPSRCIKQDLQTNFNDNELKIKDDVANDSNDTSLQLLHKKDAIYLTNSYV